MPITIGSNIASLNAQSRLSKTSSELGNVYERLSSGMRINKASDDAAGLSIADSLRSDRRVFNQGIRNFNDGISLLNIADSAVESLSNIVVRLKELAEQSANEVYSPTQRAAIDKEAQALSKEFTRVAQTTKMNGLNLFDGSVGTIRLQGGYGLIGGISSGLGGAIGSGTFNIPSSTAGYLFQSGETVSNSVLADLNGDGNLDVVIGSTSTNGTATIRLGNGAGGFGNSLAYQMGSGPGSVKVNVADLNNDGIMDIFGTADSGADHTTVRLGVGDGTFGASISYLSDSTFEFDVTAGDLNGDGFLDLVSTGATGAAGIVGVRMGNGDGTFGSSTTYSAMSANVKLGDLNGDGILDLVSGGGSFGDAYISIRLGSGSGTFGAATSYTMAGSSAGSANLADFNNDGKLDLVSSDNGNTVSIRLGSGNGTFGTQMSFAMSASSLTTSDVNGDGNIDLIGGGGTALNVRYGTGSGSFGSVVSMWGTGPSSAYNVAGISSGDVNGDSVNDIITTSYNSDPLGNMYVMTAATKNGVSSINEFELKTMAGSLQALSLFDKKLKSLISQRGEIGSFLSRVAVGINNLQSATENYAVAENRIRDADIASESANLVRLQILQQASASILGQANLQPSIALTLLNGGKR